MTRCSFPLASLRVFAIISVCVCVLLLCFGDVAVCYKNARVCVCLCKIFVLRDFSLFFPSFKYVYKRFLSNMATI